MDTPFTKHRSFCGKTRLAIAPAARVRTRALPDHRGTLLLWFLLGLLFLLGQGCAALGIGLLGSAATTVTKTGVSYGLDSRAQKTFSAPMGQVKTSLMVALSTMAFPVQTEEKTGEGERVVAQVDGREVEASLEAVTPKATKLLVVVREGWFWRDRATAEEIVDQTGRGVEEYVVAERARARALAMANPQPSAPEALRAAPAADLRGATRWPNAPANGNGASPAAGPGRQPQPVAMAMSMYAVDEQSAPAPPPDGSAGTWLDATAAVQPAVASLPPGPPKVDDGESRFRVLRPVRLRECPEPSCAWAARVKKGDVVIRLRERDQWWRVWVAGTDAVGWVPATEVALQGWVESSHRASPAAAR
jgi:hypothetical protein